jgi:hypothetical protein
VSVSITGAANKWVRISARLGATQDASGTGGLRGSLILSPSATVVGKTSTIAGTTYSESSFGAIGGTEITVADSGSETSYVIMWEGLTQIGAGGSLTLSLKLAQETDDATYPVTAPELLSFITAQILN